MRKKLPTSLLSKHVRFNTRVRGFSLIEFMVASVISIIVLMAAGATYFSTFQVKQQIKAKVAYEQDIRNTANLLRHDARQVGDYNCLALGDPKNDLNHIFPTVFMSNEQAIQSISTKIPSELSDYFRQIENKGVFFAYGNDALGKENDGKTCGDSFQATDSVINGVAYVVGQTDADTHNNLYRMIFEHGSWSAPQMVAKNVRVMKQSFEYLKNSDECPTQPSDGKKSLQFNKLDDIDTAKKYAPALMTTTLITCPGDAFGDDGQCIKDKQHEGEVTYVIEAMVRQGDVCSNKAGSNE